MLPIVLLLVPSGSQARASRRVCMAIGLALVALAAAGATTGAAPTSASVNAFLRQEFRLSRGQLDDVDRGRAVVRSLDTVDGRELATVGVVRLAAPAAVYAARLRDIGSMEAGSVVRQVGVFGASPDARDVEALQLEPDLVGKLRACQPSGCGVHLTAPAIEALAALRWETPTATAEATGIVKSMLADVARAYAARGDAGLVTYRDGTDATSVRAELERLVQSPPAILRRFRTLAAHLDGYPQAHAAGAHDVIHWSKVRLGPAVVVTVAHLAVVPVSGDPPVAFAAASKQIYSSRYFDASLSLTLLLEDRDAGGSGTWLVYVNRSRVDAFGGFFGRLKRAFARPRVRSGIRRALEAIRDRVQRQSAPAAAMPARPGRDGGAARPRASGRDASSTHAMPPGAAATGRACRRCT